MRVRPVIRRLLGRLGQALAVLLAAYTVVFLILRLVPGDPVTVMLTSSGELTRAATPEQVAVLEAKFGLDEPVAVQYASQLVGMLRGDLGLSYTTGRPVTEAIAERAGSTLALSSLALLLATAGGLVLACSAAVTRSAWLRSLLRRLPAVGVSVPSFWTGLLLVQLFSFTLVWLPSGGSSGASSIVLPAITLAIPASAVIAQVLIKGFDEVLDEPYIDTARVTGASRLRVLLRHALPNAAAPALTVLALLVGNLVTGTVVVETLFSRSGVGRLTQDAVLHQDFPVVQGITMIAAAAFVAVNLASDLVYPRLDPRQRGAAVGRAVPAVAS